MEQTFINDFIEWAKNIDSIFGLIAFLFIGIIAVMFFLYKKDKEIFNKIIDKITGAKNEKNFKLVIDAINEKTNIQQLEINQIKHQIQVVSDNNLKTSVNSEKLSSTVELVLKDITKISQYIDKQNKTQQFDNKIRSEIDFQITDKGINNKEFITLVKTGERYGIDFFNIMKDVGLEKYNVLNLKNELRSQFKQLRNSVTSENIKGFDKVSASIRDNVVLPQIDNFVRIFENKQTALHNGELLEAFENLCIDFVKNIVIQSYNEIK